VCLKLNCVVCEELSFFHPLSRHEKYFTLGIITRKYPRCDNSAVNKRPWWQQEEKGEAEKEVEREEGADVEGSDEVVERKRKRSEAEHSEKRQKVDLMVGEDAEEDFILVELGESWSGESDEEESDEEVDEMDD